MDMLGKVCDSMMKRLVCTGVGQVAWQHVDVRTPAEGEVRIKATYGVEKHGTMMAFYKGYANQRGSWDSEHLLHRPDGALWNYPIPLGNMQCGTIVEVGLNASLHVGDPVFYSGPFQPEITLKEVNCRSLPPHVAPESALLMDPAEFALGTIRDGHARAGDALAVFGLGAIGLVTIQIAKHAGIHPIIALDPIASRREVARLCGADAVIDPSDGDTGLKLRELTEMRGPDVIIDFSGSPFALQAALRGISYGGTIVCGAFPPPHQQGLDFGGEAHMNRPHIVFSRACSDPNPDHPRWSWSRIQETVVGMIHHSVIDGSKIMSEPVNFADLLTEYPKIATDPGRSIKLSVTYE